MINYNKQILEFNTCIKTMKTLVLLFDKNHFIQISPFLKYKKIAKDQLIFLPLDIHSLKKVKNAGYEFISLSHEFKEELREITFKNLSRNFVEWIEMKINNGQSLKDFLEVENVNMWELTKNDLGFRLFDKIYFIELIYHILLKLSPEKLILPFFPKRITLSPLATIRRATLVRLAESFGVRIITGGPLAISTFIYFWHWLSQKVKSISLFFWLIPSRLIFKFNLFRKRAAYVKNNYNQINKEKILFWGAFQYFDGPAVIPVLKNLKNNNFYPKIIIDKNNFDNFSNLFSNSDIPISFAGSFARNAKKIFLKNNFYSYRKKWLFLKKYSQIKRVFSYREVSLFNEEYDDFARFLSPKKVKNIFMVYALASHILKIEKPAFLILADTQNIIGKICARVAKERKIPHLCIPDAVDQFYENLPLLDLEKYSAYAVTGKAVIKKLEREGIILSDNQILITGSTFFDRYAGISPIGSTKNIYSKLKIPETMGLFIFTMQIDLLENKELIDVITKAMQSFPDKYLIIRPHPKDSDSIRFTYSKQNKSGNVIFSKDFSFQDIASISELVMTVYSITGFEAILLGKPLITINLSPFPEAMPYVRFGAALGVSQEEELVPAIQKALYDLSVRKSLSEGRKKIIEEYAYEPDGRTGERIAKLIEELAYSKNKRVDEMLIRDFIDSDEIAINDLFNSTFSLKRSIDEWRWKFKQNLAGKSYIYVAEKNNKVIGHFGAIPTSISINGDVFVAYQYLDAIVDSSFRGEGIFTNILNYSLSQVKANKMLVMGFPNRVVYDLETAKLNIMPGLGEVDMYINDNLLSIKKDNFNTAFLNANNIFKVEKFDKRFDLLWDKVSCEYEIALAKDKDYLNWRYITKPESSYTIFAIGDKTEVKGFIVLKTTEAIGHKKGYIVDILSLKDIEIIQELLLYGLHYFIKQDVDLAITYIRDSFISNMLPRFGFIKVKTEEIAKKYKIERMYLVVNNFNSQVATKALYKKENWRIVLGDSDWI